MSSRPRIENKLELASILIYVVYLAPPQRLT